MSAASSELPPVVRPGGAAADIRSAFERFGFDEMGCATRLGVSSPREIARAVPLAADPTPSSARDPQELLVDLFLRRRAVSKVELERSVGVATVRALAGAALLTEATNESGAVAAPVALFPCYGFVIATDWPVISTVDNPVMALHAPSYDLAAATQRSAVGRVLDVGTGSGIHALLASRHADEVVATDISARACAFARANADLNGIENLAVVEGPLFDPVERQKFDLVVANPPYNPTLFAPAGSNFWSGGRSGEEVVRPLLEGLAEHLSDAGTGQIITLLSDRSDGSAVDRARGWLGSSCDVVFLFDRVVDPVHAMASKEKTADLRTTLSRMGGLLEAEWRRQGITGFWFGVVNARFSPGGQSGRHTVVPFEASVVGAAAPVDLDSLFAALRY